MSQLSAFYCHIIENLKSESFIAELGNFILFNADNAKLTRTTGVFYLLFENIPRYVDMHLHHPRPFYSPFGLDHVIHTIVAHPSYDI